MADSPLDQLVESFRKFPGIGPRQARRFVYYLLRANHGTVDTLVKQIKDLKASIAQCPDCFRFYPLTFNAKAGDPCPICRDTSRSSSELMIVEKDLDLENIERTDTYRGYYFVLGGLIPILEKEPERRVRLRELEAVVARRRAGGLKEVILALSANPEGDYTSQYLRRFLSPDVASLLPEFKISTLGRGLSTGTELEYSDADTLKNALRHRD